MYLYSAALGVVVGLKESRRRSADLESAGIEDMHDPGSLLLRIPLLRGWVNKSRNRRGLAASHFAPTANKRLYFVDERQQVLKRWVEPPPAPPAEAGFGRFVGLGREPVPRRPPSRIHGVGPTRHDEVWVEALYLLTDLGKTAGRHIRRRTEPAYGPL